MKKILILLLVLISWQFVFSQNKKNLNFTASEDVFTSHSNPVIEQITKNIQQARNSEDVLSQRYWESKLHEITQPQEIEENPNVLKVIKINEQQSPVEALNFTALTGSIIVANSISRERVTGNIYAAIGVYGGVANPDTLKIYRSTNNGFNFNLISVLTEGNLKISNNGLDVEAASKGDSSYAFVAMNYMVSGNTSSTVVRIRQDGAMLSVAGGFGNATNRYINGRVTSDNAKYTSSSYIYFTVTLDSLVGGTRRLVQKLYKSEAPFAPTFKVVSGYQDAAAGNYGYFVSGSAPDSAKFETDIAFVNTTTNVDQLYTVTIVRGVPSVFGNGTSLHFTRSIDYGTTIPSLFLVIDPAFLKESPRFAATGFSNNSAVVVTRRLFAGGNWDPYYFYTTDITPSIPDFSVGFVDNTADTTLGVSAAGLYRSNGSYLFAFSNRRGPNNSTINIRQFKGGILSTAVQANPPNLAGTSGYGYPDAGFRNVNNDSCLVIWGGTVGIGSYVTGGCSGAFTGIGVNSSIVEGYSLSQNYPNPFNPSTVINFALPVKSMVSIKVYDVNGKEIAELINEEKDSGSHSIEFIGINLSSGVYYYKLTAGDFSQVRKMVLVK